MEVQGINENSKASDGKRVWIQGIHCCGQSGGTPAGTAPTAPRTLLPLPAFFLRPH